MPDKPCVVVSSSFQSAWVEAIKQLEQRGWECNNLIVQIENVVEFDKTFHDGVDQFSKHMGMLPPKDVAYTIFPHKLYESKGTKDALFDAYNKSGGLYDRTRNRPRSGWGTYFRRMTHYKNSKGEVVNQLDKVICAINNWEKVHKAAYTIVIPQPGLENARPRGGPCLNYIIPQVNQSGDKVSVSLLCIYRNHDFLERAYGNYWALCNLTQFIAQETLSIPGQLTCVSSHAYVPSHKTELKELLGL